MASYERSVDAARHLMLGFAERTGVGSARPPRRYLWTDAFAVCNLHGLAQQTGEARYTELALDLIDQVHHTLGRHRDDDSRSGWLSGLGEREGAARPTLGGLRIGKKLPERGAGEPIDERLEWDRDGQYFHYLTRWMHALDVTARLTGDARYYRWALDLARVAFQAFAVTGAESRMVWKMSIDLSRPQVPSMGQHDPLDGLITCAQIEETGRMLAGSGNNELAGEIAAYAAMLSGATLVTEDPLGLGGLLADAAHVEQLARRDAIAGGRLLLENLLVAALVGLPRLLADTELSRPAQLRLAFRELGLAIGLAGLDPSRDDRHPRIRDLVDRLARYRPLREAVVSFWLEPRHRRAASWTEHLDINEVMLATSLIPDCYLLLPACTAAVASNR